MSLLNVTSQELSAEITTWINAATEHRTEAAQSIILGCVPKKKIPAISAEELENLIGDALDDNYFEEWLNINDTQSPSEQRDLIFIDKSMVFHAFRLAEDEHLRNKALDCLNTLNIIELEIV